MKFISLLTMTLVLGHLSVSQAQIGPRHDDHGFFGDRNALISKAQNLTNALGSPYLRLDPRDARDIDSLLDQALRIIEVSSHPQPQPPIYQPLPPNPYARLEGHTTAQCTATSLPGVVAYATAKVVGGQVYTQIKLFCGLNNSIFADSGMVPGTTSSFSQYANCGDRHLTTGTVSVNPAGITCSVNYAGYPGSGSATWQ